MQEPITLLRIPDEQYIDFRYRMIFNCFKWDPQVGDINTVSNDVVILDPATAQQLAHWAEGLAQETVELEESLLQNPSLYGTLGLPRDIQKALQQASEYRQEDHVRLMRFDFHPTVDGWAISEVNSDVPGGFAEASILPRLAANLFKGVQPFGDLAASLGEAFVNDFPKGSRLGFVHATSYSDDRQVMEFLAEYFTSYGFTSAMIAPDHVKWKDGEAICVAEGQEGRLDGLIRFFPVEWLRTLPRIVDWRGYFRSAVPACNHPAVIVTQSKRLPLVWEKLGVSVPTWRMLLPETTDPRCVDWKQDGWILKPAFGRVGENISIREVISPKEWKKIYWNAQIRPRKWVAQRRFKSLPLQSVSGERHLCVGVFTVQGKAAGFYGRISSYPRIDAGAQDIAIVVSTKEEI